MHEYMNVCMCVCMCVHECMNVRMCDFVGMRMCVLAFTRVHVHEYACMCQCMQVCMHVLHECVLAYAYASVYA